MERVFKGVLVLIASGGIAAMMLISNQALQRVISTHDPALYLKWRDACLDKFTDSKGTRILDDCEAFAEEHSRVAK